VGLGTTSPSDHNGFTRIVDISGSGGGAVYCRTGTSSSNVAIFGQSGSDVYVVNKASGNTRFFVADAEKMRLDTSGRLLVGTTSSEAFNGIAAALQVEGSTGGTARASIYRASNDSGGPLLLFAKSRSTSHAVVSDDDVLGQIDFYGSDGTDTNQIAARIQASVDGTPGSNDMPGRLDFYTTVDGSSSPTLRARITQKGVLKAAGNFGIVDPDGPNHEFNYQDGSNHVVRVDAASTSYSQAGGGIFHINCRTGNSSGWTFGGWYSGNVSDREFNFRGDGNGYADGSWNGGGADYAEFFEWSDGNTANEDRRGISVVLDGEKIREAVAGEEPIGVISGNPSVVGDADIDRWKGKYLRDDYGTYIREDCEVEDDDGNTVVQQCRQLNPDYNPDTEYVSREDRPEWDTVGLMGKLRIRKGQVTGTRWIKMRDVSGTVEEWLVR